MKIDAVVGPVDKFPEKVAKYLKTEFKPFHRRVFPDGEICPRMSFDSKELSGKEVLVIARAKGGNEFKPNEHIIELLFAAKSLVDAGAKVNVLMPYLVYARQDKVFRPGEVESAKHVFDLFHAIGVKKMFTISSHMQREEGKLKFYSKMPCFTISAFKEIGAYLKEKEGLSKPLVLGPDMSAGSEAAEVATILGADNSSLSKTRDVNTGATQTEGELPNLSGRDIVIVDDIASTGGTLVKAITKCKEKNADRIICVVVHAVMAGDCYNIVKNTGAEFLATTTMDSKISKIHLEKKIAEFIRSA